MRIGQGKKEVLTAVMAGVKIREAPIPEHTD
jgi:hypothetical protein